MCLLFIVGEMRPNPSRHDQDERPVIHIQPISPTNKFIVGIACEAAVGPRCQGQADSSGSRATFKSELIAPMQS